jgi:hypothetical protein
MSPTRPLDSAVKAEVTADLNGLPHGRITDRDGEAQVFTSGLRDLEVWFLALGGHIARQPAGNKAALWTLRTNTDHGHGVPVAVYALALDSDQIDPSIADAVTQTPAA